METCPFCPVSAERIVLESQTAIAAWSEKGGNFVVAPRRHVGKISELCAKEQNELSNLVAQVRRKLDRDKGANSIDFEERIEDGNVQHAHVQLVPNSQDVDEGIKTQLKEARKDYFELGGWQALTSGEWLLPLIRKSLRNYWERANVDYFQSKYGTVDKARIAEKLIKVAAQNSALLGAVVGMTVSTDEVVTVLTAAEGGVGLPANIAIAAAAIASEVILLLRVQLQLVVNLGKLYGVPLDPDDPEDIATVLNFALGGKATAEVGKFVIKVGGKAGGQAAKRIFQGGLLHELKRIAAKVGVKILQRSIVKYTVPVASIAIGAIWNNEDGRKNRAETLP